MFGCYDFDVKDHKLKLIILAEKKICLNGKVLCGGGTEAKNEIEEILKLKR